MLNIGNNIAQVVADLLGIPERIQNATPVYFQNKEKEIYQQGRDIVEQVVYIAFPEGNYIRRGTSTSTADFGILNSIMTAPQVSGVTLGMSSASSALADTIPKTAKGRARFDTYAGWMITGGGFLEPLGIDERNFMDVWVSYFAMTLPYDFLKEVVVPNI